MTGWGSFLTSTYVLPNKALQRTRRLRRAAELRSLDAKRESQDEDTIHLRWKATGRTLGAGGQGQVHEVTDPATDGGKPFAMKILSTGKPEQAYARFYREIEALKALDHPGILKIVDHSEVGAKFHFYVMHLIPEACPLADVIFSPSNPFFKNPVKCLDLLDRILDVLVACESNTPRILHRDLKPANILLLPDDSVRIIDFGICQIEGATTITLVDEGVGAQNYMAPECESGAEGQAGPYSDLYSVGRSSGQALRECAYLPGRVLCSMANQCRSDFQTIPPHGTFSTFSRTRSGGILRTDIKLLQLAVSLFDGSVNW